MATQKNRNFLQRVLDFLGYDEVSLFCLNYSFLLMLILDVDLIWKSILFSFNPVFFVYGMSVVISMYLSIKHLWSNQEKTTREVFFMVGGGGWLAVSVAFVTWGRTSQDDYLSLFFAGYSFLYNLAILWFMGLMNGLEIAREFLSEREAHISEALISTVLVTLLALGLRMVFHWEWWQTMNACIFYTLSANKIILGVWHELRASQRLESK